MSDRKISKITSLQKVDVRRIYCLRKTILRPSESQLSWCKYVGDFDTHSFHLRALSNCGSAVGIGSFINETKKINQSIYHYRLRGIGVLTEYRKQGIGGAILSELIRLKPEQDRKIWLSGRTHHEKWYSRFGFSKVGPIYDVPGTGPHSLFIEI